MKATSPILIAALFLCTGNAFAQSVDKDPAAIVELGGAPSWNIKDGGSSFGPSVAVEVTPIEKWLELEAGVTPLFTRHSTEWNTDLLFKKPWTLSKKVEFMLGVGPEWVHATKFGVTTNSVSGEVAADFMFWPSAKHRFGWYLEPAYDYSFARGHEQSLGITGGLLPRVFAPSAPQPRHFERSRPIFSSAFASRECVGLRREKSLFSFAGCPRLRFSTWGVFDFSFFPPFFALPGAPGCASLPGAFASSFSPAFSAQHRRCAICIPDVSAGRATI